MNFSRKTLLAFGAAVVFLASKPARALHVDVRYVFIGVDSIDTIRDRYNNNPKADFWHGTAGLNFKF